MDEPELALYLKPEHVKEYVTYISVIAEDDERAHSCEDALHQAVLNAIASDQCSDPMECAKEALKTLEIGFARWYA